MGETTLAPSAVRSVALTDNFDGGAPTVDVWNLHEGQTWGQRSSAGTHTGAVVIALDFRYDLDPSLTYTDYRLDFTATGLAFVNGLGTWSGIRMYWPREDLPVDWYDRESGLGTDWADAGIAVPEVLTPGSLTQSTGTSAPIDQPDSTGSVWVRFLTNSGLVGAPGATANQSVNLEVAEALLTASWVRGTPTRLYPRDDHLSESARIHPSPRSIQSGNRNSSYY